MRDIHSRLCSTGLWLALSVGSLGATASSAWAAEASIQTNANGEVLSHTSTVILQQKLAAQHAYQGKIDGVWGKQTETALRNFQAKNQLQASGKVDAPTAEKLGVTIERMELGDKDQARNQPSAGRDSATDVHSSSDDANTSVQLSALSTAQAKEMQQRLQLLGYYRGPIDGTVGQGTRSALRKFFDHQANLAAKGSVSNAAISLFGTQPNEIQRVKGTDSPR